VASYWRCVFRCLIASQVTNTAWSSGLGLDFTTLPATRPSRNRYRHPTGQHLPGHRLNDLHQMWCLLLGEHPPPAHLLAHPRPPPQGLAALVMPEPFTCIEHGNARTTSQLEGGINNGTRTVLRSHRGLTEPHTKGAPCKPPISHSRR